MIRNAVIIAPQARVDLLRLYDWVADAASPGVALAYLERIEVHLNTFDLAPERGERRDDIRPGLRIAGFERRLVIAFVVQPDRTVILRVFSGGQDWASALADGEP